VFVRRIITAYVLALGVILLILSGGLVPEANWSGERPVDVYDGAGTEPVEEADLPPRLTETNEAAVRPVRLDPGEGDIPLTALLAYRRAADVMTEAKPSCGLSWPLLAAIGRVESDHGRADGARLGEDGVSRPTRGGPEGVGPMRFFPAVWQVVAVDGDGDGERSPHDIDDAALAAAVYLCASGDDLRDAAAMRAAVRSYNDSGRYVDLVLAYEEKYRSGDFLVSAPSGAARPASVVLDGPRLDATPLGGQSAAAARIKDRVKAEVRDALTAAQAATPTGGASPSAAPAVSTTSAGPSAKPQASAAGPSETQGGSKPSGSPDAGSPASSPAGSPGEGLPATGSPGESSGPSSPSTPATSPATSPGTTPPSGGGGGGADEQPSQTPDPEPCTTEDASSGPGDTETTDPGPEEDGALEDAARCEATESPTPSADGSPAD
jgi:hypothetical protein